MLIKIENVTMPPSLQQRLQMCFRENTNNAQNYTYFLCPEKLTEVICDIDQLEKKLDYNSTDAVQQVDKDGPSKIFIVILLKQSLFQRPDLFVVKQVRFLHHSKLASKNIASLTVDFY